MKVVVIGGSNIDLFAMANEPLNLHDSNPGKIVESFGGVGRNIAENLGKLKCHPTLITAVGKEDKARFLKHLDAAGVTTYIIETEETSRYVAILDADLDMFVSVSAMESIENITIKMLKVYEKTLKSADIIVFDTNLVEEVIEYILSLPNTKFFVDGISQKKVAKLRPYINKIDVLKINQYEAEALFELEDMSVLDIVKYINVPLNHEIYLTAGKSGVYQIKSAEVNHRALTPVKNAHTTGAGDAFLAGVIYGVLHRKDSMLYGLLNARFCLKRFEAVHPKLTIENLENIRSDIDE